MGIFEAIYKWLTDFWLSIVNFGKSFGLTLWDIFKDGCIYLLEFILEAVQIILDGMGTLFAAMDLAQYVDGIPPDVAQIMGLIGLGQAVSIILAAISIRVVLQLIPFTRLGS